MSDGLLDTDAAANFLDISPNELRRLSNDGAIQRQNGKYHPVRLVRGYVEHIKKQAEQSEYLTQTEIARRLDMSDRNLREVLNNLKLDHRNTRFSDIAIAYIRDLREKAAGRGGEDQAALTKARTAQAIADANMKELAFHKEIQNLVPGEEIEPLLESWATVARSEFQNAILKLVAAVESQYKIQVDTDLVDETFTLALGTVGSYPTQFAENAGARGAEVHTT